MPTRRASRAKRLAVSDLHAFRMQCMYNACMPVSITIRNVPDDTRDELAARAARSHRSLQEYLRAELMALAERPDPEALVERIRERVSRTRTELDAETILRLRDADRK
jgi:plasmid stability protein